MISIMEGYYSELYILKCTTFHYVYLYVLLVFSKKNDFLFWYLYSIIYEICIVCMLITYFNTIHNFSDFFSFISENNWLYIICLVLLWFYNAFVNTSRNWIKQNWILTFLLNIQCNMEVQNLLMIVLWICIKKYYCTTVTSIHFGL